MSLRVPFKPSLKYSPFAVSHRSTVDVRERAGYFFSDVKRKTKCASSIHQFPLLSGLNALDACGLLSILFRYKMNREHCMTDSGAESLILDLLEWLAKQDRGYEEVMDAWRTSCPKLPVWEDANDRGLLTLDVHHGQTVVRLTPAGVTLS